MRISLWRAVLIGGTMTLTACATVGPSSVRLSAETGARSAELAALHQDLVRKYFDSERRRIETFLREKWEPQYLRNLLGISGIMDDLRSSMSFDSAKREELRLAMAGYLTDPEESARLVDEIITELTRSRAAEPDAVREIVRGFVPDDRVESATAHAAALLGTAEPALLIIEFAEDAHVEMEKQRRDMIAPLDAAEAQVLSGLSDAYTALARAQGVLTARLEAASHAAQQQDELLQAVGISDPAAIRSRLAGISDVVGNALADAGSPNDPNDIINKLKAGLTKLSSVVGVKPPTAVDAP